MDDEELIAIIISAVFALIYIYNILLFFGVGGSFLAGFNTTSKCKNAKSENVYKYLLRRYALIFLLIVLDTHASVMAFIFKYNILGGVLLAGVLPICIISTLILRKNKKFMAAYNYEKENKNERNY